MKKVIVTLLIVMLANVLAGCGMDNENNISLNKQTDQIINQANDVDEQNIDVIDYTENSSIEESEDDFELYADDSKYVFETTENTIATYYHNGEKITGYEIMVKCDNNEMAEMAKNEFLKQNEENVESVRVEGKNMIIKYSLEAYEDIALSDIQETYSLLKQLKDAQNQSK